VAAEHLLDDFDVGFVYPSVSLLVHPDVRRGCGFRLGKKLPEG